MAGLVAPPDNVDPVGAEIAADGWFPATRLDDIRNTVRLGEGAVTTDRLKAAIEGAILSGLRALAKWRTARVAEGAAALADVTVETVNDINRAELLWQRVVRYYAAAELADTHRDISATDDGLDRAEEKSDTADEYRRLAYAAVADLQSIGGEPAPRNRVTLV